MTVPVTAGGIGLRLLPPRIRYSHDVPQQPDAQPAVAAWREVATGRWRYDDGLLVVELATRALTPAKEGTAFGLEISATAVVPLRIGVCAFVIEFSTGGEILFLDRYSRWRHLTDEAWLNDFGAFVLQWASPAGIPLELRAARGSVAARLTRTGKNVRAEFFLDAAALHPRWKFLRSGRASTADPSWSVGQKVSLSLIAGPSSASGHPAAVSRFPYGAEAALTLTDHCDFDSVERLSAFLEGAEGGARWLRRGLRMTKGVFLLPSAPGSEPAPTLADGQYRKLIAALHADGSEIAPHALAESGNLPGDEFRRAVNRFAEAWSPKTWIDHGKSIDYCYTMGGADNPDYRLLETLRENGFHALWSYHDIPRHGSAGLNVCGGKSGSTGVMAGRLASHLARGEALIGLHYARSILEAALPGRLGTLAAHAISSGRALATSAVGRGRPLKEEIARTVERFSTALRSSSDSREEQRRLPYSRGELESMGAIVYPAEGVPLYRADDQSLLLFVTMEAVHTGDIYTPEALDRLVTERGIHIGHCYLMNNLRYIAGLFERPGDRVSGAWAEFLDSLAALVGSGRLWNPTAGMLTSWVRDREQISLLRSGASSVLVDNPLRSTLEGFTILLPKETVASKITWDGSMPSGWKSWGDSMAVWGPLPAQRRVEVTWGMS